MMKTTVGMIAEYGAVFLGGGGNGPFSEVKYRQLPRFDKHSLISWLVKANLLVLVSKLVPNQSALALGILLKIYCVFNLL